ncbi:uncharacterized protein LY89DRAFT_712987 [Mollisia scopiformis]|uniref:Pentatricopeptide repeat protein n=1 Tax=Mollisia scopiformis TaxID=149040 RepID=A0A194XVL8_MOLSC|nr:uncharacterized protein LY89DRAFT_712987 [Mollisia scopiformis]KUJ24049.1 hypothetical protein LY89DRAFT_712987 [Mollisia scopiformis]
MPPPQHLLSPRLRGFVCKSCLSKLRAPRRQQLPWVTRTYASDDKPKRRKGAWDLPHGTVRYFEQTRDGVRTELKDEEDDDDAEFTESVKEQLRQLEERTGKTMYDLDEQDLQDILHGTLANTQEEDPLKGFPDPAEIEKDLTAMAAHNQDIQAQMDLINSFDLENLSEEDRVRLREGLLGSVKKDKSPPIPHQPESRVPGGNRGSNETNFPVLPISSFPTRSHTYLRGLEKCVYHTGAEGSSFKRPLRRRSRLESALSDDAIRTRKTWRSYAMCRSALVSSPQLVPLRFWAALWDILGLEDVHNLDRLLHLKTLGDDMLKAGVHMRLDQRLLYIEATFIVADQASAIQTWEFMGRNLAESSSRGKYWDLGTRMFCRHGLIDRAISCAENILDHTKDPTDFRLLLPIIGAVLRSDDKSSMQRAWALYIRLRFNIGAKITMEDYDSLISMFMEANHREQALSVFKDMMLTGDARRADRDSISRYTNGVGRSAILSSLKILPSELDWQDFKVVDRLPARLNNRVFFASWMKKLIGDGEIESAEKVFHLMQDHGIRPSSISTNGLIGAWYRKGNMKYREKADALAWQMIRERQNVVALRDQKLSTERLQRPIRPVISEDKPDSRPVNLVSYATIETFEILLEQYRQRQKYSLIPSLFEALTEARIKPNVGFMNQLLMTDMKAQSPLWALNTYRSLTDPTKSAGSIVRPNFDTYQILWEMMARDSDPVSVRSKNPYKLVQPRTMFKEMVYHLKSQKGPIPNDLYQTMILCFCLHKDQVGTAVALRALQFFFGNFPTEVTARAVVLQIARQGLMNEAGLSASRRLNVKAEVTQRRIHVVTQALASLREHRVEVLSEQGIDFEGLEGDVKLEETLLLLSQLLRYGYEHKPVTGVELEAAPEACRRAAKQMGVPECKPWESESDV